MAWALEEIGVDYEPVALSADECRDQAYRQRHPLGRVPALELDDGQVLSPSRGFAGVLDAAPARVVDYLDRLQARPAYAHALARTESLLEP